MKKKLLILFLPICGFGSQAIAQGDLLITPNRVVFDGNKQNEELNLVNIGKDTARYSISFVQYNMNEDGSFKAIKEPDPGQMFADPFLRIFPRNVTLAPHEPQVIMLQRKRVPDMAPGEYRSHLYFRSEKNNIPLGLSNPLQDSGKLSIQLIPIYGLSIPVIIRSGAVNVSVTLSDLKLEVRQDTLQFLDITINRKGNISTYGNILVQYIPAQGKTYEIGFVKGVGVYTNINKRHIAVKLRNIPGKILTGGKLKVQYLNASSSKSSVYAENEMEIK